MAHEKLGQQAALLGQFIDTLYGNLVWVSARRQGRHWVLMVWPREDAPATAFRVADVAKAVDQGDLVFAPDATLSVPV